jgi:ATP-dependent protease Clp ATPase subunit
MYETPSDTSISKVVVGKTCVTEKAKPNIIRKMTA